ncbi:5789_t:CDS:1 [Cetraspora pellucida]|uniref:5789_t:CDS:1 n=1 Tax=Cetraspora pellucida TaxID=1433469 RepID=A0A9N8ZIC8_9GLOM|nr:5789_t:CDS:1 [Cetraspora pellucida]
MSQAIFNHLNSNQRTATKYITFQCTNGQPSLSGEQLNIYDYNSSGQQLNGELDLGIFPNLRKITFPQNVRFNILESIDISKNEKLSRIVISGQNQNFLENNSFILLAKEIQLNRIIVSYYVLKQNPSAWEKTENYLRKQTIIPYMAVEDKKVGQLEAEVANLKQSLAQKDQTISQKNQAIAQKDQTIADLNTKTPTLSQFQELSNIALNCNELDFNKLKQEIKRLKLKDFNPYFQKQKNNLEQLTSTAKNKAGESLNGIIDLFLQTNKQIIESENADNNSYSQGQLQGQLVTCKTLLQTKLTTEELQNLLNKQKEFKELEKHAAILQ